MSYSWKQLSEDILQSSIEETLNSSQRIDPSQEINIQKATGSNLYIDYVYLQGKKNTYELQLFFNEAQSAAPFLMFTSKLV